nr:Chain C, NP338-V6L peptide [unidentified influenza virus]
FEDLRLLSF